MKVLLRPQKFIAAFGGDWAKNVLVTFWKLLGRVEKVNPTLYIEFVQSCPLPLVNNSFLILTKAGPHNVRKFWESVLKYENWMEIVYQSESVRATNVASDLASFLPWTRALSQWQKLPQRSTTGWNSGGTGTLGITTTSQASFYLANSGFPVSFEKVQKKALYL